jgi:DNA-binding winged helix-turn-helix (wHTH) protein
MARTVAEIVETEAGSIVGRDDEKAVLLRLTGGDRPLAVFVHGVAGVGKTALLEAVAAEARARGTTVLHLDARAIEPTERGFLRALSKAAGARLDSIDAAAKRLGELSDRVIIALDTYEVARLLDPWLRQAFVPALHDNVRLLVAGRDRPVSGWANAFGPLFQSLHLENLSGDDALALLRRSGVAAADAVRLNRLARGHPLSLRLAASASAARPGLTLETVAAEAVLEELTQVYLAALDRATRAALAAASIVRRPTLSLLAAMLPETAPQDAFDRVRALPFVESGPDGLVVHDTIREGVAALLRASDPQTHRRYRTAAWHQLSAELKTAATSDYWRYTADVLYLIENAIVREAFFPTSVHRYSVEPAEPGDAAAVAEIAERNEPPGAAAILLAWWATVPETFRVVRDDGGVVVGFLILAESETLPYGLVEDDPVARCWREHLRRRPVPRGQRVLFHRRFLARDTGDAPSPVQAACWLDVKRVYMELRPELRRLYAPVRDLETWGPVVAPLGFEAIPEPTLIDGVAYHSAFLDFGPASVDGWLAKLVDAELRIGADALLDARQRALVLDGQRIQLTKLEFDVLAYLYEREGDAVDRPTLLRDVWGTEYTGGSNVVEAVVRSLRKKLGPDAQRIQTVRGLGYRWTSNERRERRDSNPRPPA